ncbi:hypothetical protein SERLADRAFT_369188 [Serpula lacrymans var. lacrymans S7.9]|uniref:Cytochrome P450 n=1 Tax=Serpula lacrymans var. lacrymans (strain S7.9) TaxID=578457 RepID=F8NU52_SERL9|nr:uncharacterized protein SERLADRAFT_369188 [Serpula lacrymans var. lacrymans S7.9]EGO25818.1 hypothetical protein SERLADRAFT_369188 [Serpula lacrymans var. lacrymans S7.9]
MLEVISAFSYAFVTALVLSIAISKFMRRPNVDSIPSVGPGGLLTSYWAAVKFIFYAREMLQEGYTKASMAFKIPGLFCWNIFLSGPKLVEELRRAPEDHISARERISDPRYTIGHTIIHNPYHIPIILTQLTRNLPAQFPDILDEIQASFDDHLQLNGYEWTSVPAFETIVQVVCRTSNRVFVGLPLCNCINLSSPKLISIRPDWNDLTSGFALSVVKVAITIDFFPNFMAPLVNRLLSNLPKSVQRGMKHLRPIIEERQKCLDEYGSGWEDKPNDMLSWLMDEAQGEERSAESLTKRMLSINLGAIHGFTHALFYLAAHPQYINPLREEVEAIVEEEGCFLKETLRFDGLTFISMLRKAVKDFTFSDGTFVPAGCTVSVASMPIHRDSDIYKNADIFDPFRFSNEEQEGEQAWHQMASTHPGYLPFGHRRSACPGRFFTAIELKTMLAHVVVTYDVKFRDGQRPANVTFGPANSPDMKAKILFRKRVV